MILSDDYTRIATEEDSEFYKGHFSEKRSWWISPGGEVIDSGHNHAKFVRDNPEIFGGPNIAFTAKERGWIKVGHFGGTFYLEGNTISKRQLETIQDLCRSVGWKPYVTVDLLNKSGQLPEEEFLRLDSPNELRRELWGVSYRHLGYKR